jgi:hypothetical protein
MITPRVIVLKIEPMNESMNLSTGIGPFSRSAAYIGAAASRVKTGNSGYMPGETGKS